MSGFFPQGFEDLEGFEGWSLATENERAHKRITSEQAELERLYAFVHSRLADIVKHLDQYPLTELPLESARLMLLMLSLAEVSPAIECYHQPSVPDGYDLNRLTIHQ